MRNLLLLHLAIMVDRGFKLTLQAVRRQLAAMPYQLYQIRLIHSRTHRAMAGRHLWTDVDLLQPDTLRFLRASNCQGYDVYIRPDGWDQNAGYVLVDLDYADGEVIERMRWNGHHPCLVLQTSPGHLQAWVQVARYGIEAPTATAVAGQLARLYGGDPGSADWRHLGRLAGFTNQKPIRCSSRGLPPWIKILHACAGLAPNGQALIDAAHVTRRPGSATDLDTQAIPGPDESMTVAEAAALYNDCALRWRIAERFRPPDWSRVDLWVARDLLLRGMAASHVQTVLQLASPQFPRRHGNPADYLRRTVARAAFFPKGGSV